MDTTHCQVCGKPFLWMSQSLFGPYCQCIRYGYATTTVAEANDQRAMHGQVIAALRADLKNAEGELAALKQSIFDLSHPNCRMLIAERDAARAQLATMTADRDKYYWTLAGALHAGCFDTLTVKELREPGEKLAAELAEAKKQAALGWERHAEKDRAYQRTLEERDEESERLCTALNAAQNEEVRITAKCAAWRTCAEHLAADLRGCSECCDCADCVCRESLAEFDRLAKTS